MPLWAEVAPEGQAAPVFAPELLAQVAALPALPGVYRYFDAEGILLYVGKARNLKRRVSSYFHKDHGGTRTGHMVRKIASLQTTVVRTEDEALLLENNLIKTQHPRYNILFRDDKSYPYLKIAGLPSGVVRPKTGELADKRSTSERFPRLAYWRGAVDKRSSYFGPFPNAAAVKDSIELLQKVFLLRTCEDSVFAHRTRACLLHQIKRCSAPCVGLISEADYAADVDSARALLSGRTQGLLDELQRRMMAQAEAQHYEQAAATRDQIAALSSVLQQQAIESTHAQDVDIIAVAVRGGQACVNLAMVRAGRHLGDRAFIPSQVAQALALLSPQDGALSDVGNAPNTENMPECPQTPSTQSADLGRGCAPALSPDALAHALACQVLDAFIAQHYVEMAAPAVLITSHPVDGDLLATIGRRAGRKITLVQQPQAQRRIWLEMAERGAQLHLQQSLNQHSAQVERTRALAHALQWPGAEDEAALAALHIECFDISHTSGEHTQAACVVFAAHQMQRSHYRRYTIGGITGGDDYAAMRQALLRRYRPVAERLQNQDKSTQLNENSENLQEDDVSSVQAFSGAFDAGGLPDIVLIDGGRGQVGVAREVFAELGLDIGRIVGVEKGEGRRVGLEELVFADGRAKIWLGEHNPALMLIAHIRDEAHRFAITGMRAARAKARTEKSRLEDIAGIGPKRRARLLQRFGGARGVENASVEELKTVEGISQALAEEIYRALH